MCKKTNYKGPNVRIDKCLKLGIKVMNEVNLKTISSCCGHGKYEPTILLKYKDHVIDVFSLVIIKRKRKFYKRDKQGYYYIPEVVNNGRSKARSTKI